MPVAILAERAIFRVVIFQGEFVEEQFSGGGGGNLPGGNFPSAVKNQNEFELLNNLGLVPTSAIIFIALDFLER